MGPRQGWEPATVARRPPLDDVRLVIPRPGGIADQVELLVIGAETGL